MNTQNKFYRSVLKQIKDYGPVSATAIASSMKIDNVKKVQNSVAYMRSKLKLNIQKNRKKQYYYSENESESLNSLEKIIEEEKERSDPGKRTVVHDNVICPPYDPLIERCHYLIKALEHCSSNIIMDSFNLNEEEARVLVNKVAAKFSDINISFSVSLRKG